MKTKLLLLFTIITTAALAQNQLKSSINQYDDGNDFVNSYGENYEYDTDGNLISATSYNWSGTSWSISDKRELTYNSNNKVIEELYQNWNSTTGQYENTDKSIFSYNSNGLVNQYLGQEWVSNQWTNYYRSNVSYDGNNQVTQIISEEYENGQWINSERSLYTFSNNKLIEIIYEEWDNNQWDTENTVRESFTYNGENKIFRYTYDYWDGNSWVEEEQTEYTFDASGNRISRTDIYNGDSTTFNYSYNSSQQMNDYFHPFKDKTGFDYLTEDFPYINKILEETASTGNRTIYDYDNAITLSNPTYELENTITIYPNPSSNYIKIDGLSDNENIKIFNLLGKKVLDKSIQPNEEINIRNLSKGIYLLKIDKKRTIKFIKK